MYFFTNQSLNLISRVKIYITIFRRGLQYYFYLSDRNIHQGKRNIVGPVTGVGGPYWGLAGLLPQEIESKDTDKMYYLILHSFAMNVLKAGTEGAWSSSWIVQQGRAGQGGQEHLCLQLHWLGTHLRPRQCTCRPFPQEQFNTPFLMCSTLLCINSMYRCAQREQREKERKKRAVCLARQLGIFFF